MSEKIKKIETQETEARAQKDALSAAKKDPIEYYSKGRLKLSRPIQSNDKTVDLLEYDFRAIGGLEFARCMDKGNTSLRNNTYNVTDEQALHLFAAAVEKKMEDVDAADVRDGLSIEDTVKAVQIATAFFVVCTQEGNKRIMNASSH